MSVDNLPMAIKPESKLLLACTNEIETILISVALSQCLETPLVRLFMSHLGLGRLSNVPVFRQGKTPTVLIGFPTPRLAQDEEAARKVLKLGLDLTWISEHPLDADEIAAAPRLRLEPVDQGLWQTVCRVLGCPRSAIEPFAGIAAELGEPLVDPQVADHDTAWRYCLEAACQEPQYLGPSSAGLISGLQPDPILVLAGHQLIVQRSQLAADSSFHTFDTPNGRAVLVLAPRRALGFYYGLAHEVRRRRSCVLSVLAFDTGEPLIVEYEQRPSDFKLRMEMIGSRFPEHVVRPYGPSGIAIKGSKAGSLDVLDPLIELLSSEIN
ncbi:MAG: hypothetical protein P9M14_03475 [Candidatus Alcyoniella australis]|nr:hypothetical protein [Candidatus Alcyoniella australis]